jgi:transcription elongation factor Elf1
LEQRIQVSFSTDGDGFISQQCPSCERRFKVRVDESSDQSVNFCPYCGSQSDNGWLTEEQQAYAMGVVSEQVVDPMLEEFTHKLQRMNRPGGLLSVSGHYEKSAKPQKPVEAEEPMPLFTPPCCNEPIKHDGSVAALHCVVCGVQTPR